MKNLFRIVTLLIAAFIIHSSASAQENAGITFSMIKKDGKLITRNTQEQKILDFFVTGLNTNEEVDAFIAKFKAIKGVVDITVSYDLADNQRTASTTFPANADRYFIKSVLIDAGVAQVIIDGKTYNTSDIPLKKTERKTETEKTSK